jgi:hypothetical protein
MVTLFACFPQKYQHGMKLLDARHMSRSYFSYFGPLVSNLKPTFLNVFGLHMSCGVHHSLVIPTSINVVNVMGDLKYRG